MGCFKLASIFVFTQLIAHTHIDEALLKNAIHIKWNYPNKRLVLLLLLLGIKFFNQWS